MTTESKRDLVLGTAGHIDHGKSTLVQALTGTDPDRLSEEKQRGITIEVVAGLVATVLLALVVDAAVQGIGWALTPWVRQERA